MPEFLEAVRGVAGLRHPNVEQLVGCCVEHGQRLLVYRHFSDRALDGVLRLEHGASTSGPDENETLRWDARVAVALEAAKALEYVRHARHRGRTLLAPSNYIVFYFLFFYFLLMNLNMQGIFMRAPGSRWSTGTSGRSTSWSTASSGCRSPDAALLRSWLR